MAKLHITEGFKQDLLAVESDRVLLQILDVVELMKSVPTMGSRDLPESIRREFGNNARKTPVSPFDIVTIYDEETDTLTVAGLIHQRAAW